MLTYKDKKKILFVSSYDLRRNTSSNIRTVALMQALRNKGFDIDCFCISANKECDESIGEILSNSCNKVIFYKDIENRKTIEKCDSGNIIYNKIYSILKRTIISLYSKFSVYDVFKLQYLNLKAKDFIDLDKDYDFIVSSSEPRSSHDLAIKIKEKLHLTCPWIQYWGDPMTSDVASQKIGVHRESVEEEKLINLADKVIYTNPLVVEYMKNLYPSCENKIFWIPTTDIEFDIHNTTDLKKEFVVSYVGDYLSKFRNILPLYNACNNNMIKAAIVGNSDFTLNSSSAVSVTNRVSRERANEIEAKSQILVVLENKVENGFSIQVPGKLYHYALTNKPILVITESDSLKQNYGIYKRFIFVGNNETDIKNAISRIIDDEKSKKVYAPLFDFSQNNIGDKFIDIISSYL